MKNHSTHAAFEADFKAFLDGELTFLRRLQMRRHLQNCPHCREEIRIMQTIETELKSEENVPLEADLRAKILGNVPFEAPQVASQPPRPVSRRLVRQMAVGAVGTVIVAAIVAPPFFGARENARRSELQSNLNQIGLGTMQYTQNNDEKFPAGASASAGASAGAASAPSAAPRNAPLAKSMRSVNNWARAGGAFSDGHLKNEINGEKTIISGNSTSPLTGDGSGIYLDNSLTQRQVHKEGSLTVITDNAEAGGLAVENIVKNAGGFVASQSLSTGTGELRSAVLDCRVPVEKFEFVTQKIGALGRVRAKSLNGEDITARVAAAAARKTALTREFSVASAQLQQKEKTAKKRDAQSLYYARLEVRQLRVQAAQSRAALQNLQRFSALASLYVTVQDKPKPVAAVGGTMGLGGTARAAWSSFLASAQLPLQLLIWIAAYAPLWLPALILWRKFGRKWIAAA